MYSGVKLKGPILEGRAPAVIDDLRMEVTEELGRRAEDRVQTELTQVLRQRTGRYQSGIHVERRSVGGIRVHDGGIVYGPWLEGRAPRNKWTRFKGYHTFTRVTWWLGSQVGQITDEVAARMVRRLE